MISGRSYDHHLIPRHTRGFTIVELLIVVVVIAILATITIVAYRGVTDQANDSAVQSDLRHIAQVLNASKAQTGVLPAASAAGLEPLGISVSKGSYGDGYVTGSSKYNIVYCRGNDDTTFGLAAWSKSGSGFAVVGDTVRPFAYAAATNTTTCPRVGLSAGTFSYAWFYNGSGWQSFVGGS